MCDTILFLPFVFWVLLKEPWDIDQVVKLEKRGTVKRYYVCVRVGTCRE